MARSGGILTNKETRVYYTGKNTVFAAIKAWLCYTPDVLSLGH